MPHEPLGALLVKPPSTSLLIAALLRQSPLLASQGQHTRNSSRSSPGIGIKSLTVAMLKTSPLNSFNILSDRE